MVAVGAVPVVEWTDGLTVQSVVLAGGGELDHEYWVMRDGEVLIKCPSLAAVDEWRHATS